MVRRDHDKFMPPSPTAAPVRSSKVVDIARAIRGAAASCGLVVGAVATGWVISQGATKEAIIVGVCGLLCVLAAVQRGALIGLLVLAAMNGVPFLATSNRIVSQATGQDLAAVTLIVATMFWRISRPAIGPRSRVAVVVSRYGIVLLAWIAFSIVNTDVSGEATFGQATAFGRPFVYFAVLLIILPRLWLSRREIVVAAGVLAAGALAYGIGQVVDSVGLGQLSWLVHTNVTVQETGLERSYADMADLAEAAFCFAFAVVMMGPTRRARWFAGAVLCVFTASILVQQGRARWLALLVSLVVLVTYYARAGRRTGRVGNLRARAGAIAATSVLVVMVAGLVHPAILHGGLIDRALRGLSNLVNGSGTIGEREAIVTNMLAILRGHWLLGVGLIPPSAHYFYTLPEGSLMNPDVGVMNGIMTIGVIGVLGLYLPILVAGRHVAQTGKIYGNSLKGAAGLGGAVWIGTTVFSSVTLITLYSTSGLVMAAVLLALLLQTLGDPAPPEGLLAGPGQARATRLETGRSDEGDPRQTLSLDISSEKRIADFGMAPTRRVVSRPMPRPPVPASHTMPLSRLLATLSGVTLLQAFSSGMAFITAIVLARLLGRAGYGRYSLAVGWASLLTVPALLGFDRLMTRSLAVYQQAEEWGRLRGLIRIGNALVLATSIGIGTVGVLVCTLASPGSLAPFALGMVLVPVAALTLLRVAGMQALHKVVQGQIPEYLVRPLLLLAAVAVVHYVGGWSLTAATAVAITVVASVIAFVTGALWLRRVLKVIPKHTAPRYELVPWLRSAVPMLFVNGIWTINAYVGLLAVGALVGARTAAVYSVVDNGAGIVALVLVASNVSLAPEMARLFVVGNFVQLERNAVHVARAGVVASLPVVGVFLAVPNLYLGVFGHTFSVGAAALAILTVGQLVNAWAGPAGMVLLMTGYEKQAAAGVGCGLVVNVILAAVLVPIWGLAGGAFATAASVATWNVLLVVLARRCVGVSTVALGARWLAKLLPADARHKVTCEWRHV